MIKIENVVLPSVQQWLAIISGTRNPKNSWDKIDSGSCELFLTNCDPEGDGCNKCPHEWDDPNCNSLDYRNDFIMGPNDHKLMTSLAKGGPVHAKYRRMITVYLDITAPLYWWKEFDTYKVGTVANSCSTMHKIHAKEFELDDFSYEHLFEVGSIEGMYYLQVAEEEFTSGDVLDTIIEALNNYRKLFLKTNDKKYWWQMIQLLPTSYNQKRTVMLNYEVLNNIYHSRKNHKLDEWHTFCNWIKDLPYSELIIGEVDDPNHN